MREAQFLKQNADKWKQYEQEIHHFDSPDTFADRFVELTDDLAYSRTFYPNSNTTKYLNGLTSLFHQKIYRNKKEKRARILSFWQYELPFLFKQYHPQLLYSFLFFIAFTLIGVLSAKYDDSFVRLILSDDYVNMTNQNIAKGDPFGVYKSQDETSMFVQIASNNIRISFLAFIAGITWSVGTVLLLMQNGIMLGSFEYYFFSKGLGLQSIPVIFLHGTLELSAIVIAGCSGLILGSSLLFPKTYSRWYSLIKGGRDGIKIVFGLIPVFLTAAFLESFVTRHTKMPLVLSYSILLVSLAFIIWYFIIYPLQLNRRVERVVNQDDHSEDQNFKLWLNKRLSSEKSATLAKI